MKLITEDIEERRLANWRDGREDHRPVVKFFDPTGSATWLIAEMSPEGVRITQAHLARTLDLSKEESLGFAKQVREMMQQGVRFQDVATSALAARQADRGA